MEACPDKKVPFGRVDIFACFFVFLYPFIFLLAEWQFADLHSSELRTQEFEIHAEYIPLLDGVCGWLYNPSY